MKIETFLKKIDYKVYSGEIYSGQYLPDKLLYWVNFTDNSEKNNGKLLIGAKNQHIYYIEYYLDKKCYIYHHKMIITNKEHNKITLKQMLQLIEK